MTSSRKSNSSGSKSNDILHILTIIFLVIIIGVIIYLIYKTLKGKGEFFKLMNTIENYTMTLTETDKTLDPYKENQMKFKSDLTADVSTYTASFDAATNEYGSYNTDYNSLKTDDLQKKLDAVNSKITTINSQISNIKDSSEADSALKDLNTLISSLSSLNSDITKTQESAKALQSKNKTVADLLLKASENAKIVINDINEGNKIKQAFTDNYAKPVVQPKIDAAKTALEKIDAVGNSDTEKQIISTSKSKLQGTIDSLDKLIKDASTKLDNSSYIAQRDTITTQKTQVDDNKKTIDSYVELLSKISTQLQTIEDTCSSYQTNLPKISVSLENMSKLITNSDELTNFMTGL